MDFLRRELIGGLSLIVALAVFAESDYRLTLPVALSPQNYREALSFVTRPGWRRTANSYL
jgi:hypothetical protein